MIGKMLQFQHQLQLEKLQPSQLPQNQQLLQLHLLPQEVLQLELNLFTHHRQDQPQLFCSHSTINPNSVDKSGPKGNLTKADVLKFIKDKALPTPAPADVPLPQGSAPKQTEVSYSQDTPAYVDIELSNMRKVIAKRLTESKQFAPHGYSTSTADLTAINRLRQEYI